MELPSVFSSKKTWDWVLLLTYDFGPDYFFETEILNNIRANKNITVVIDESNYNIIICDPSFKPNYFGIYYNLEKVRMRNGGKFHPKLFLQLSEDELMLSVGSANLTESGFKKNLECISTSSFKKESLDREELVYLAEVKKQIRTSFIEDNELIDRRSVSLGLKKLILDISEAPFFKYVESEVSKYARRKNPYYFLSTIGGSLFSQVKELIEPGFKKIQVLSPFYDDNSQLFDRISQVSKKVEIYIPKKDSSFPCELVEVKKYSNMIDFFSTEKTDREKTRFIHAKYYSFTKSNSEKWDLITSANFTSAGMFSDAFPRNYEVALLFKSDEKRFLWGSDILCEKLDSFEQIIKRTEGDIGGQEIIGNVYVESAHYDGQKIYLKLADCFLKEKTIADFIIELLIEGHKEGEYPILVKDGQYFVQPSLEIEGDKLIQVRMKSEQREEHASIIICVNREKHNPNYLPSLGASAFHQCVRVGGTEGIRKAFEFARASNRKDWLIYLLANWDLEKILQGLQRQRSEEGSNGQDNSGDIDIIPVLRRPMVSRRNKKINKNIDLSIKEMNLFDELVRYVNGIEKVSLDYNDRLNNYIDYCYPVFIQIAQYFKGLLSREEKKKLSKPYLTYPEYNWLEIYNRNEEFLYFIFNNIKTRLFYVNYNKFGDRKKYFALLALTYLWLKLQTKKTRREFIEKYEEIGKFYAEIVMKIREFLIGNDGYILKISSISNYYDTSLDNLIIRFLRSTNERGEENFIK